MASFAILPLLFALSARQELFWSRSVPELHDHRHHGGQGGTAGPGGRAGESEHLLHFAIEQENPKKTPTSPPRSPTS